MDINKIAAAIRADAGEDLPELEQSLAEMQQQQIGRQYTDAQRMVRAVRVSIKYSQPRFANLIATSVGSLRDWEQGRAEPTGTAVKLAGLIKRHPELVNELEQMSA